METLHVAIIPDGNRRWGRLNNIVSPKKLYDLGMDSLTTISKEAMQLGVTHLSLWGSSYNNLTARSKSFRLRFLQENCKFHGSRFY